MNGILLLLGSNLGDRLVQLQTAIRQLERQGVYTVEISSVYETKPYGIREQPDFLNAVIRVKTESPPEKLLEACLHVENIMGRIRERKWGKRLIDIDVLFYHDEQWNNNMLTLPHYGISDRRFTLLPLVELAATGTHPVNGKTMEQLLEACTDDTTCVKTQLVLKP